MRYEGNDVNILIETKGATRTRCRAKDERGTREQSGMLRRRDWWLSHKDGEGRHTHGRKDVQPPECFVKPTPDEGETENAEPGERYECAESGEIDPLVEALLTIRDIISERASGNEVRELTA